MPEVKRPIYGTLSDSPVFEIEFLGQDEQIVSSRIYAFGSAASNRLVRRGKELRVTLRSELVPWIPNLQRQSRQTALWRNVFTQVLQLEGEFFTAKVCFSDHHSKSSVPKG
jgi:hypothetical protein